MAGADDSSGKPPEQGEAAPVESWLDPFFSDPGLWPVLAVVLICGATFGAAALLLASQRLGVAAALLLLAGMSVEFLWRAWRRRRRLGRPGWLVLGLWLLSGALALLLRRSGVF